MKTINSLFFQLFITGSILDHSSGEVFSFDTETHWTFFIEGMNHFFLLMIVPCSIAIEDHPKVMIEELSALKMIGNEKHIDNSNPLEISEKEKTVCLW